MVTTQRETALGALQGEAVGGDVAVFRGAPYAAPPVGARRWRPAEPPRAWGGVRYAVNFAPACPQFVMAPGNILHHPALQTSEDCLYLNIWTCAEAGAGAPVMVWIHGGGLIAGSGCFPEYDGSALARKGVVVVTINYRLGVFGYLTHPGLRAESPHRASGNYGLSDQIQALRWVREHIAAFGGDPDNVTIWGESAGGWAVSQLMAAPSAAGLFHRAIGQSGASHHLMRHASAPVRDRRAAEDDGRDWALARGAETVEALRALPAETVLEHWLDSGMMTDAVVDGWLLPDQVRTLFEQGRHARVPVLVGFNAQEASTLAELGAIQPPETPQAYRAAAQACYGPMAEAFLERYPPDDPRGSALRAFTDGRPGIWEMETWARLSAAAGDAAYLYCFSHPAPAPKAGLGAYHMAEIPYAFGHVAARAGFRYPILAEPGPTPDAEARLAALMSDYWVAFARNGDPNGAGRPVWAPYDAGARAYMEFDGTARPGVNVQPGAWAFWEAVEADRRARGVFANAIFDPAQPGFPL